jgi:para-nitrobenzyl esterase
MMRVWLCVVLPTLALAFLAMPTAAADLRVTGGLIRGLDQSDGSSIYLGIPYAAAPIGDLRWKPPAPVLPWRGVRDAVQPPAPCLQHDEGWNSVDAAAGKEDCLYLSIHSPRHKPHQHLPVMFWIHGGSNMAGSGFGYLDSTIHQHGIVLVSIEYRLGVFGFLASPQLSAESAMHASGNYALLDQIAALHWVQDNIARFGGDPTHVTISGQSAGGYDVALLLLTPLARALFHQAIEQSAALGFVFHPRMATDSEKIGTRLAALLGATDGPEALKRMRTLSGDALLKAADELKPEAGDPLPLWGQAAIDGYVLTRTPADVLGDISEAHVPLIVGNNAREFGLDGGADTARAFLTATFGTQAPALIASYGLDAPGEPALDPELGGVGMQIPSDLAFRCPANRMAAFQVQTGRSVWRYQFGVGPPGSGKPSEHSSELKYVFNPAPADANFATWPPVQAYWANFIRSGDPNGPGLPGWPSLGEQANYMSFTPQGPQPGKDLRGALCRLMNRSH